MREALAAGDPSGRLAGMKLLGTAPPVLCKFFLRAACQKGSACPFSHELQGLPTVPLDKKLRTPCRFFELGQCMRGPACKFAHGEEEIEQIANAKMGGGGKKKARSEPPDHPAESSGAEAPSPPDALAVLSSATGFKDFHRFDPQAAGPTDLEARAEREETDAGPSMDTAWAAFLAQVAEGPGSTTSGGGTAGGKAQSDEEEAPPARGRSGEQRTRLRDADSSGWERWEPPQREEEALPARWGGWRRRPPGAVVPAQGTQRQAPSVPAAFAGWRAPAQAGKASRRLW